MSAVGPAGFGFPGCPVCGSTDRLDGGGCPVCSAPPPALIVEEEEAAAEPNGSPHDRREPERQAARGEDFGTEPASPAYNEAPGDPGPVEAPADQAVVVLRTRNGTEEPAHDGAGQASASI